MTLTTSKYDIWFQGKSTTIRLMPAIWKAFQAKCDVEGVNMSTGAACAQRTHNGSLAEAITAWVGNVPLHGTCQEWLDKLTEQLRPIFAERGYPLPAKITAKIGFPSTGWKGKRRGEHWSPEASQDGQTHQIFIHPCETDPLRILNIHTHELVHAAQHAYAHKIGKPKQAGGHGTVFKRVAAALDLEGKGTSALGGAIWKAWAEPLLEVAGPLPHNPLAEAVKKAPKQATRWLKFEHEGCPEAQSETGYTWRAAAGGVAHKARVHCPCCGQNIVNPHASESKDESEDELGDEHRVLETIESDQEVTENRMRGGRTQRNKRMTTPHSMAERCAFASDGPPLGSLRQAIRKGRRFL